MFSKTNRVICLLVILAVAVIVLATRQQSPVPDWDRPLKVVIYPHNADGSEQAASYIARLDRLIFQPIETFMAEQAAPYDLPAGIPFTLVLGEPIKQAPAAPPVDGGFPARARWGLAVRWWYWRFRRQHNNPDIIVVARYFRPQEEPGMLHSIGFSGFRLALARLIADDSAARHNSVIIAHEILHTVGANDLYDPVTGLPRYPEGYAQPDRRPRYPQPAAELMAGRILLAPGRAREAENLDQTSIGKTTAGEIGWADSSP